MSRSQSLRDYAVDHVASRLGRLAFEVRRARKKMDDEAVHDLRVSIRRFTQSLRVFAALLSKREARHIRVRLRELMHLAGAVRDLDIARELILQSRIPVGPALLAGLAAQRKEAQRALADELHHFVRRDLTSRWRERLHLRG